jgi:hypothetical protein
MKSLDCNTPRGQIYIGTQLSCHTRIEEALNCEVISTNTKSSSDIDALLVRNKILIGLGEVKSREMSFDLISKKLMYNGRGYDSYLITHEKLEKLRNLCKIFNVSGFLFVSLLLDGKIAVWKICDANGNFCVEMKKEKTKTQATCNGGTAFRENAYLSLNSMQILKEKVLT